ncbi:MAG: flagellar basal body L-ring protein FlgH [Firmicutes bacterium]|nr:flagellar basal body L-ring protein FlgH [Bacillota bacterium]
MRSAIFRAVFRGGLVRPLVRPVLVAACLVAACLIVLLAGPVQTVQGESLWQKANSQAGLFADHKAGTVGDLLTIIIVEQTQASQNAETTRNKDGSMTIGPGTGILSRILPLIGASGNDKSNARGKTTTSGNLSGRVTVRVMEVMANGNLVVEGHHTATINKDKQEIVITGIVRPDDVTRENTVLSTYVAEAKVTFLGSGPIANKQRQGILTQILDWLF